MRNTHQLIIALTAFFLGTLTALAGPIDVNTARHKAADFLNEKASRATFSEELSLRYATSNAYLFENNTDFALVAASDELPEILGYGSKAEGELPPALEGYLKAMKVAPSPKQKAKFAPVKPLLTFVRHQRAPYYNHCPYFVERNGVVTKYHCVVGCVATALEEVISYYRRTVVLQDTLHGWESKKHTAVADILPGTTVDCRLIRDNYDVDDYTPEEEDAVARLSYYCGVAAKMNWGIEASGANIRNLIEPMKKAFGYQYVEYVDSYQYNPKDWLEMMRKEIYAHRPVLYTAYYMWLGGHAFVIDGLDERGRFHVNWGYAGSYDGYFCLDVLNYNEPPEQMTPEGMEAGFFINHQALLLHPDEVDNVLPDTLSRTGYEIVIDSVTVNLQAETQKRTPISLHIHNTTDEYLRTPFEIFTNLPQDTAMLEQADFNAMTSAILAPHERRTLKVHANFNKAGERILRVSPDDEAILYEGPISIVEGKAPELTFHEPQITFPAADEAFITVEVHNADSAGRCGQEVLYEVGPGNADTMKDGTRHSRHLYVQPGESIKDTIRFQFLEPEKTYTLLVRSPWKVQTQKTFVMPQPSGITSTVERPSQKSTLWYGIDGRIISAPKEKGIYLRKEGNKIQKIYIHK